MLKLTKAPGNSYVNMWIVDEAIFKSRFPNHVIIGPALIDNKGEIENGDWIKDVGGVPTVDVPLKAQIKAQWASDKAEGRSRRDELLAIKFDKINWSSVTTIAALKSIVRDLAKLQGGK